MPPFSSFLNTPNQTSSMPSSSPSSSLRLSNESFSFSWLPDVDEPSFELGHHVASTHRSSTSDANYDFDFGLSRRLSPLLVHADQIFSNGFLLPLRNVVDQSSKSESTTTTTSESSSDSRSLSRSLSLDSSESYISFSNRYCCDATSRRRRCRLLASTGGSSIKTKLPFLKSCARKCLCLSFLFPWRKKASWRKTQIMTAPPAAGDGFSIAQRRRGHRISDNSYESAIDDAILHCKKSVSNT